MVANRDVVGDARREGGDQILPCVPYGDIATAIAKLQGGGQMRVYER
jgi:hypothetical protein